MSDWKDSDEVTTTFGSIQLSLQQAHAAGMKTERARIIKLLEEMKQVCLSSTSAIGEHNAWTLENAIELIKGENNE